MIISSAHRELMAWVTKTMAEPLAKAEPPVPKPKTNGHGNGADKRAMDTRLAKRGRDDEALLEAMQDSPSGSIGGWAKAIDKNRTSTVAALHRLREAGLAESVEGKWRLLEESPPKEPPPKWVSAIPPLMKLSIDDLPSIGVSRMRAAGQIRSDSATALVGFPDAGLSFTVGVQHVRFKNGGDWAFFVCRCSRRCRTLRLYENAPACRRCLGERGLRPKIQLIPTERRAEYLAPRLIARLNSTTPARLHPRPGRMLDRRQWLEAKLRRTLIVARRARIEEFEEDLARL